MSGLIHLLTGGMLYEGFTEVEVRRTLKETAGEFTLHVSDPHSGGNDGPSVPLSRPIREDDPCTILYDSMRVLTGHVEGVQPRYSKKHHSVTIQGRSKTGDIVDSSVDDEIEGGELRDVTLDQVARLATKRFGIGVVNMAELKDRLDVARTYPGETVHRFIERYARSQGVDLTDDENGNLRLFQHKGGGIVATLIEGVNIIEASAMLRSDKKHSKVSSKGQQSGAGDGEYGSKAAQKKASIAKGGSKRHRPLTLLNEHKSTSRTAQGRAAWEAAKKSGETVRAEIKVAGWTTGGMSGGKIWMPGMNVMILSPMLYLARELTVQSVVLTQSRSKGTMATLACTPGEAHTPKSGGKAGGTSDRSWNESRATGEPEEEWPMP